MKLLIAFEVALVALFTLTGCMSGTGTTIREYDTGGNMLKETVTTESVVQTVVNSTKEKIVFLNDQSWIGGIRLVPPGSSIENPMGTFEVLAGKRDFIMMTAPQKPAADISKATAGYTSMIEAARSGKVAVGKDGIGAATE